MDVSAWKGQGQKGPGTWRCLLVVETLIQVDKHHFSFISVGQLAKQGDPHHALGNGVPRGDDKRYSRLLASPLFP